MCKTPFTRNSFKYLKFVSYLVKNCGGNAPCVSLLYCFVRLVCPCSSLRWFYHQLNKTDHIIANLCCIDQTLLSPEAPTSSWIHLLPKTVFDIGTLRGIYCSLAIFFFKVHYHHSELHYCPLVWAVNIKRAECDRTAANEISQLLFTCLAVLCFPTGRDGHRHADPWDAVPGSASVYGDETGRAPVHRRHAETNGRGAPVRELYSQCLKSHPYVWDVISHQSRPQSTVMRSMSGNRLRFSDSINNIAYQSPSLLTIFSILIGWGNKIK